MKIKILPLDERPCNLRFVQKICNYSSDVELVSPKVEILSNKKVPACFDDICEYVFSNNSNIDYLVMSLDMYLYGGLLPSRLHNHSIETLIERLSKLIELKHSFPNLKIYGFSTIMRTPKYSSSDEEPDYYGECGYEIFMKKYLEDKLDIMGELSQEEQLQLDEIEIDSRYEQDYQLRRGVNLNVNLEIIKLLKNEVFDYLIFPQDDSAPFGYTRIDQDAVHSSLKFVKSECYSVHPGADEVLMTLVSRIKNINSKSNRVFIKFENPDYVGLIPNYEDRSLMKTLLLHLDASGFVLSEDIDASDHLLYYNVPQGEEMYESFDQNVNVDKDFDLEIFNLGRRVYVLDNCYSNGGDFLLVKKLFSSQYRDLIAGYSGWNTNANALGTILCQMAFGDNVNGIGLLNFNYERIIEDCFYQGLVRKIVTDEYLSKLGLNYFDLMDKACDVVSIEIKLLEKYITEVLNVSGSLRISHPWNRMFEIDIDYKLGGLYEPKS